jgi:hypothetical protein
MRIKNKNLVSFLGVKDLYASGVFKRLFFNDFISVLKKSWAVQVMGISPCGLRASRPTYLRSWTLCLSYSGDNSYFSLA